MTVLFPEATPVLGNLKLALVDAIASMAAPSLASEIGDSGTLDISCYVRAWNPTPTTNSGTAPARVCTLVDLPREGKTQMPGISIAYPYDPQADDTTTENKAKAKLVRGTELFVVVRKGLPFSTAFALADRTETWKVVCGRQNKVQSDDTEYAEFEIQQMLFPVAQDVVDGVIAA